MSTVNTAAEPDHDAALRALLGERLRALRRARGLTREQTCAQLRDEMSAGTLGSYESGARRLSVFRLMEICAVLGVTASQVLEEVQHDAGGQPRIRVRLRTITQSREPELRPLRAWAAARAADLSAGPDHEIDIDWQTLEQAAHLCGMTPARMLRHLGEG